MLRHLLLLGALIAPWLAGAEVKTMTVDYTHGETALEGYVAYDAASAEKRPVVMIVHQWMGLTDHERGRADRLAGMGYVAFAVDMYGKGVRPRNREQAGEQASKYRTDRQLMRDRIAAALTFARTLPFADPQRIACIGYCFGGGVALELARSGAELQGVVSFHGNLDSPLPAKPGEIKARILVCHGAADTSVRMDQVTAFHLAMEEAKADWQLVIYANAVHGFTHTNDADRYHAAADRRSWQHMQDFFAEIFP